MNQNHPRNADYALETYDPAWTERFAAMKAMLQDVFGAKALEIEHVGSTSIEGMRAKPVVDALVIVPDVVDLKAEREALEKFGYIYTDDVTAEDTLLLCKQAGGMRLENIHIYPRGHERISWFIDKRDYLRAHPEEARHYEEVKRLLNEKFPDDYVAYEAGKKDYLNHELVEKMAAWKKARI